MENGDRYGFYGGGLGGGFTNSQSFTLDSLIANLWGQSHQNSENYNGTFIPSSAFGEMSSYNATPSLTMDQSSSRIDSMFFDGGQLTNFEQLRNMYLDHPYMNFNNEVINPSNQNLNGRVNNSRKLGQWTREEDRKLDELVNEHGTRNWAPIAESMEGRAGKQCRERWYNHLRPDIKTDDWSDEEERVLIEAHQKMGNKWAEIARLLPGRTENAIKNHWNAAKRKKTLRIRNRKNASEYRKPKSTVLVDYIRGMVSTSTDNPFLCTTTVSMPPTNINNIIPNNVTSISSYELPNSYSSDSLCVNFSPPCHDEMTFIQNIFGNSTNESLIQHLQPQSSSVPLDYSANMYQNNDTEMYNQVSSIFDETNTFSYSSEQLWI